MSKNLSEEFKVEDTIQPVADPVMAQALKDEAEKEDKLEKETKEAEKIVDEINNPKKDIFKIKKLTEKIHLSEELEDDDYFDFVSEIYQAIEKVCRKWVKMMYVDLEDVNRAVDEAAVKVLDASPDLFESLNDELELSENYISNKKDYSEVKKYIDRYDNQLKMLESKISNPKNKNSIREAQENLISARNNFNQIVSKIEEILK